MATEQLETGNKKLETGNNVMETEQVETGTLGLPHLPRRNAAYIAVIIVIDRETGYAYV